MTAPKEQLLIMLFDGAIRFSEQAKVRIDSKEIEGSCTLLIRGQRIMLELIAALDKKIMGEELYFNLVRIYNFIYFRLINANVKKDKTLIDEALRILQVMRQTWIDAIEQDRRQKASPEALSRQTTEVVKNISLQG